MSETFTNIEVSTTHNMDTNDANTSVGVTVVDDINYELPTKDFNIIAVLDDAILGDIYNPRANDNGEVVSEGGIYLGSSEEVNDNALYQVMKVHMVGSNVKEVVTGEYVVVSKTAGMKVVDFDGRKCSMIRESGIFMKVTPK